MSAPEAESTSIARADFSAGCVFGGERVPMAGASVPADALDGSRWGNSSSEAIARAELAAAPWWLWWNVLSLDAPMVAAAWAVVFAKSAGVAVPGAEIAVLGLTVWLIYTVDRLLDGRSAAIETDRAGAFGPPLRQRHIFHRIHARSIAWVATGVAAFTGILIATQVGGIVLRFAVPVGLILVLYMAWVHLGRGRVLSRLPKEVAVGGVFAAGVALPAWSRLAVRRWEFCLLAILFAAVCALNCVAIEEWESLRGRDFDGGERSFATKDLGSGRFAFALAICAALMTPVVRLRGEFSAIGAAIAVSALLILILDVARERISADALRVLVDVALLVPALGVLVLR